MEDIYKAINDNSLIEKTFDTYPTLKIKNKYEMQITFKTVSYIRFGIDEDYFNIFLVPLKYKIITNDEKEISVEIVSISQLTHMVNTFPFNKPLIYCPHEDKSYFTFTYENLKEHENHLNACIKESRFITNILENSFNDFFKEGFNFMNKEIEPLKYEPNFEVYFKNSEIILKNNKLNFFHDKYQNRMKFIDMVDDSYKTLKHFFGQPGKGKTFSLIGILKYLIDHRRAGTLYINCKAFSILKEPIKIKQLIIDEIPFLFYGNYHDYLKCVNKIKNYPYNKDESSFFDLINVVIDQIINNQNKKIQYIFAFDQYKDDFDKDGKQLKSLYNKLQLNKGDKINKISLLTFSSMNNYDIRKFKIQYIQQSLSEDIEFDYQLTEIRNLEYDLSIDDGDIYNINLEKLGNGLKYYNVLNYYYSNKEDEEMKNYMIYTKSKIRNNLLDFFNIDKALKLGNDPSYLRILGSFSTDVVYDKNNLLNIINNIPFKYFDIIKIENNPEDEFENENENKNKNKNKRIEQYKIVFSFPLVGEVINEIYNDIININPNIYNNFTKFQLDGGAKGKFFEKIVTYYLNIQSSINKEKKYIDYFEDYPIDNHDKVEVLLLNDNEDIEKISFKKYLEKGIYLISQNRYNGKSLDIAILKVSDEINEIIGIQISINKNIIFKKKQIVEFLLKLKRNIYHYYHLDVNDEDLYFCYIFDWNNKVENTLRSCEKNRVKYFFFDVTNNCFVDNFGKIIKNLKLNLLSYISICPQIKKKENIGYTIEDFFPVCDNGIKLNTVQGPHIKINQKQDKSIKKFLKDNLELSFEPKIKYKFSLEGFVSTFLKNKKICCITKYEGKNKNLNQNSIVLHVDTMSEEIKENGQIYNYSKYYSNIYDYYIITE